MKISFYVHLEAFNKTQWSQTINLSTYKVKKKMSNTLECTCNLITHKWWPSDTGREICRIHETLVETPRERQAKVMDKSQKRILVPLLMSKSNYWSCFLCFLQSTSSSSANPVSSASKAPARGGWFPHLGLHGQHRVLLANTPPQDSGKPCAASFFPSIPGLCKHPHVG